MATRRYRAAMMLSATMTLAACGGGGSSPTITPTSTTTPPAPVVVVTTGDAVRLAKQGSFGPTQVLADHIAAAGTSAWLDEQFAANTSNYNDLVSRAVANNYCNVMVPAVSTCNRDYFSSTPVAMEFYAHAVANNDQLRQRVAFALSQIVVASDFEVHTTAGLAVFNQIFLDNAFGNYRTILRAATLNPFMGAYLNMVDSQKAAPNENYARELMQLFSMGINQLNADGIEKKDGAGAPIATFTSADVHDIARALTGWTYTRFAGATANDGNQLDFTKPMTPNAAQFDGTAKTFLGVTVPAGATQDANIDAVVDAVFNNASTAPYVSKFLIQQLVVSNPSPAYVGRVSAVFANNGAGVRGDLKAVIRAILTDTDARGNAKTGANDGKLKEPVLFSLSLARLLGAKSDGYAFITRDGGTGQQPFRSPSVFNFYPPDYPLPLGGGLVSPATKLITASTILARHNLAYDWTVSGDSRSEFGVQATITGSTGTQLDLSAWEALTDPAKLVDAIDLVMLNQTMTSQQRTALLAAINAITDPVATTQAHKRAQTALYIVAASPQFQVDR